mmetsp:Transcript_46662/g.148886  ORF Transcript_46662/g.148886 Transcript_46662/m.148886 type:complete len:135 (-) Transcript_46662:2-406(-)
MTFCFRAGDLPRMCSNSPVVCSSKAGFVGGSSAAGMNGMSPIDCPLGSCRHGIPVGVPVATVASAAAAGGRAGGGDGRASGGGGEGGGAGSSETYRARTTLEFPDTMIPAVPWHCGYREWEVDLYLCSNFYDFF